MHVLPFQSYCFVALVIISQQFISFRSNTQLFSIIFWFYVLISYLAYNVLNIGCFSPEVTICIIISG